ncbi:MAG: HAD family hydrolase [Ruoffia tabacinasalis]
MDNIELVIFDLDGTLLDSEKVYRQGWSQVLKGYGHDVAADEFEVMRGKSTTHNNNIIKSYLGSDELVQEARDLREEYFFEALEDNQVELMPGSKEIIRAMDEKGTKIAVATSSYSKRGLASLKKFDLLKYFDYKVFGDEVTHSKPHPEIYYKVLTLADVSSNQGIAIEDSLSGLQSALAAGLKVYFVPEVEVDLEGIEGDFEVYASLKDVQRALLGK